jgi:hypothetical protein
MKYSTLASIFVVLCLAAGLACASETKQEIKWSTLMKGEEATWQVLNVVDMLQTLDIKNHKNLQECTFSECMGSANVIGRHPNDAKVVGWMLVNAGAHFAVSNYLVNADAPKWLQQTWQVMTITGKASVVDSNFHLGMRIKF